MNCKKCRNLIETYTDDTICCEIHPYGRSKKPKKCKAYLSSKCTNEKKIKRNMRTVDVIRMEAQESLFW